VNWTDAAALKVLGEKLAEIPQAEIHLVLNAAYEIPVLLAQIRAFGMLPIRDLIFTHLDEEVRWGKLWNFVFGTNYSLRFLSAGQNIPGDFFTASPDRLLTRQLG
jgi:flagellar biosynthesis GTPase FlhF